MYHIPFHIEATGVGMLSVNSPVLCCLQPHVPAMMGVEAGHKQVGLGLRRAGGRVPLCPGARAGWVGLQRGAETHPHRVGCPVGPGSRRGGGGWQAASSDQNQLVPSTLPPHRLRGVETTAEEAVCRGEEGGLIKNLIFLHLLFS